MRNLVALPLVGPVVAYHGVGPTSQMADEVTLLEGPPRATSPAVRELGASGVHTNAPARPRC